MFSGEEEGAVEKGKVVAGEALLHGGGGGDDENRARAEAEEEVVAVAIGEAGERVVERSS